MDPVTKIIDVPAQPVSVWLRLAHLWETQAGRESDQARLRVLDDFELVLALRGRAWIYAAEDEGSVDIEPGSVAFLPPGFLHGWASGPGAHVAVHFDLHANPSLAPMENIRATDRWERRDPLGHVPRFSLRTRKDAPPMILPLVTPVREPRRWRERLDTLVQIAQRGSRESIEDQLAVAETIGWALRTIAADAARAGLTERTEADPRIMRLLRELDAARGERPSIAELARRTGMGETAFRAAFRRVTGRSPRAHLEARRIEHAARALIDTDRSVTEIALAEGYDDPYHFSRVFKRVTSQSPRAYRAEVLSPES